MRLFEAVPEWVSERQPKPSEKHSEQPELKAAKDAAPSLNLRGAAPETKQGGITSVLRHSTQAASNTVRKI